MAALSYVPIMYTWWYIEVARVYYAPSDALRRFHWISMAVFQVFYSLFLFGTDCVFPMVHHTCTSIWITAYVAQSFTTIYMSGLNDAVGRIVAVHALLGIASSMFLQ